MVNKTIHYCWFGRGEKSKVILKCIDSWKKYLPDYKIIEWNEDNFDINHNIYVKQAYEAKKYAFVSDYVRFYILEKFGGLYLDTDVEVIKPLDDLLHNEAFAGFETKTHVNTGLIMYSKNPNHELMKKTREWYDSATFLDKNGERIKKNVCDIFTDILLQYNFIANGEKQECCGMVIYPIDYFNPYDDIIGKLKKTQNTYTIHWYAKSWMSKRKKLRNKITRIIHRIFGKNIRQKLARKKK